MKTDSWVRTYAGDGKRIQTLTWSGSFDYAGGTVFRSRNPKNPTSAPGRAKVKLSVGARKMAASGRLEHQDLGPVLKDCNLRSAGENIAFGNASGAEVVAGWMNSDGHRRNIVNPGFRLFGVGAVQAADGRWWVAQVFGSFAA